jgi:signal transduction histidine kinase
MSEVVEFGRIVLIVALGCSAAIATSKLTHWVHIPGPGLFLLAAAAASDISPSLQEVLGTVIRVEGDRIRLEQALGNLVDNALRHAEGDVRLSALEVNGAVA